MKKYLLSLFFIGSMLAACKKDDTITTSNTPAMDMVDSSGSDLKYSGTFINGPYGSVMGKVKILVNENAYSMVLDSFSTSNGPDLHVYLSKEIQPIHFIDLGKLKAVSGTQLYNIPGMPDFMEFKYVLIHCQQYNHLFGNANIQ
jgi:hypothetical protein